MYKKILVWFFLLTTSAYAGSSTLDEAILKATSTNVGIGSTNPKEKLDVVGNIYATGNISCGGTCGGGGGGVGIGTVNPGNSGYFSYYPSTGSTVDDQAALYLSGSNVGIGSTNPRGKLDVGTGLIYGDGSGLINIPSTSGGWTDGGVTLSLTTSTDNVGIGTTQPLGKFTVLHSSAVHSYFINSATSGSSGGAGLVAASDDGAALASGDRLGFLLFAGSKDTTHAVPSSAGMVGYTAQAWNATATGSDLAFEVTPNNTTSRSEAMRITQAGNVGMGISSPTGRLDVRGDEVRIWTGSGSNANALSSGELYVGGDLEVDGTLYASLSGSIEANTGDSATAFFSAGTIEHARLPTTATDAVIAVPIFDVATDVSTGDGKAYIPIDSKLNGWNLVRVHAQVITAGLTGETEVDIARCAAVTTGNVCSGTVSDMLSTNLFIDSAEDSSDTAATTAVVNGSNDDVATNQVIRIDVDDVSTTEPQGLIVTMVFRMP